jgi:hypothetical protein
MVYLRNICTSSIPQENYTIEISSQTLGLFTTSEQRKKAGIFDLSLFEKKAQKYYCTPLNKTQLCPQDCLLCRPTFIKIIKEIRQIDERDPYGALVQYLRSEMEIKIELSRQVIGSRECSKNLKIPRGE